MTSDDILDLILFQTVILHQEFETQLTPKLTRELMIRFFTHTSDLIGMFSGKNKKQKYVIPDHVKDRLDAAIKKKQEMIKQ